LPIGKSGVVRRRGLSLAIEKNAENGRESAKERGPYSSASPQILSLLVKKLDRGIRGLIRNKQKDYVIQRETVVKAPKSRLRLIARACWQGLGHQSYHHRPFAEFASGVLHDGGHDGVFRLAFRKTPVAASLS
jgi:hypothetical protein